MGRVVREPVRQCEQLYTTVLALDLHLNSPLDPDPVWYVSGVGIRSMSGYIENLCRKPKFTVLCKVWRKTRDIFLLLKRSVELTTSKNYDIYQAKFWTLCTNRKCNRIVILYCTVSV
jgi:hypothetical protein